MDPIVGDPEQECDFKTVSNILMKSKSVSALLPKLIDLGRSLEIPADVVETIKTKQLRSIISQREVLHEILVSWRSSFSSEARLSVLANALEDCDLKDAADALRSEYLVHYRSQLKNYIKAPEDFDDFISSKCPILVISTRHMDVTATKLGSTVINIHHFGNEADFFTRLAKIESTSTLSQAQVHSVNCLDLDCVKATLRKLKGTSLPDNVRIVLITKAAVEKLLISLHLHKNVKVTKDLLKWSHLSCSFQDELESRLLAFSGFRTNLKSILDRVCEDTSLDSFFNEELLIHLIQDKCPNLLESNIPAPLNHYISRGILPRKLLSTDIFKSGEDSDNIFMFTGVERHELSRFASPNATDSSSNQKHLLDPTVKYMVLDMKSDFELISAKNTSRPVHWIHNKDGQLHWVKSSGSVKAIQNAVMMTTVTSQLRQQSSLNEEKFLESLDKSTNPSPVCIADTPGMGKSLLLANLGRQIASKHVDDRIVIFCVISEMTRGLKASFKRGLSLTEENILSNLTAHGELGGTLFQHCLGSAKITRIEVMLDGLDEVPTEDLQMVKESLEMLQTLSSKIRVWVTTRPHLLDDLENWLHVMGHNIQPFKREDQEKFLVSYWSQQRVDKPAMNTQRLATFAKSCLEKLRASLSRKEEDIAGIPLLCMLIAEVYQKEALQFSNTENILDSISSPVLESMIHVSSITKLYEYMIRVKVEKYFERSNASSRYTSQQLMYAHVYLSMQLLFPHLKFKCIPIEGEFELADILNLGLVEKLGCEKVARFLHRTFAEFFVAWFLIHCLQLRGDVDVVVTEEVRSLLEACLQSDTFEVSKIENWFEYSYKFKHEVICHFVNNMMPPNQIHLELNIIKTAILDMRKVAHSSVTGDFLQIFNFCHELNAFEDSGTSIFEKELVFIATLHSGVRLLSKICELYRRFHDGQGVEKVFLNNSTILDVAVQFRDYSVVDYLVSSEGFRKYIQTSEHYSKSLLLKLVEGSRDTGPTFLNEKVQVLKFLCDLNKELLEYNYSAGRTLLHSNNVHLTLLLEMVKLGADVLVVDNFQTTVLDKIASYMRAEKYHQFLASVPIQKVKRILQKSENHEETPMHTLTYYFDPLPETLTILKEAGANFNAITKTTGNTVLGLAIRQHRSLATLQHLIDHGAMWKLKLNKWKRAVMSIVPWKVNLLSSEWTVLHTSLETDNFPSFHLFVTKILVISGSNGQGLLETLQLASSWRDLEQFNLRRVGVNVNLKFEGGQVNNKGNTLLHLIMDNKRNTHKLEISRIVIESGAIVNSVNSEKFTPLESALEKSSPNLSTQLLAFLESKGGVTCSRIAYKLLRHLMTKMKPPTETEQEEREALANKILAKWSAILEESDYYEDTFLHRAATESSSAWVKFLILKGMNVNARNGKGETPMHFAAGGRKGREDPLKIVQILYQNGAELQLADDDGETPIHKCVRSRFPDIVSYFLDTTSYDLVLHDLIKFCAEKGYLEILQMILTRFQNRFGFYFLDNLENHEDEVTLFHLSSRGGNLSIFEFLLETKVFDEFVKTGDPRMNNIVHTIVRNTYWTTRRKVSVDDRVAMLELILQRNRKLIDSVDSSGKTPILVEDCHINLIKWLLDNGANARAVDKWKRNVAMISSEYLTSTKSEVTDKVDDDYHELLDYLVRNGYGDILRARGGEKNETVLHHVFRNNPSPRLESLEIFRKHGADFNATDVEGDSVLMCAVRNSFTSNAKRVLTQLLMDFGVDVNIKNKNESSVLHVACSEGSIDAVELFVNLCDVNAQDKNGNSPLDYTLRREEDRSNEDIVKLLVDKGANLEIKNKDRNLQRNPSSKWNDVVLGCVRK